MYVPPEGLNDAMVEAAGIIAGAHEGLPPQLLADAAWWPWGNVVSFLEPFGNGLGNERTTYNFMCSGFTLATFLLLLLGTQRFNQSWWCLVRGTLLLRKSRRLGFPLHSQDFIYGNGRGAHSALKLSHYRFSHGLEAHICELAGGL